MPKDLIVYRNAMDTRRCSIIRSNIGRFVVVVENQPSKLSNVIVPSIDVGGVCLTRDPANQCVAKGGTLFVKKQREEPHSPARGFVPCCPDADNLCFLRGMLGGRRLVAVACGDIVGNLPLRLHEGKRKGEVRVPSRAEAASTPTVSKSAS